VGHLRHHVALVLHRARLRPFAAALATLSCALAAPDASAQAPVPAPVPVTAGWEFHPDPGDVGARQDWAHRPPAAGWRPVAVPHVFDATPRKAEFHGTVGWYRVRLPAPARPAGFAWALRFEQVRRTAQVWLDGRPLGRHSDPYVPFDLTATGLRTGQPNELVLRVDNRKGAEPREGWWNWGGLVRPVTLVPRGPLVLHDAGLVPEVSCAPGGATCTAKVLVDGMLENRSGAAVAAPRVRLQLTPPAGAAPVDHTVTLRALQPGEATRVRVEIPVPDPALWAPGRPQRYAATLTTLAGSTAAQVDRLRVGLRQVRVANGMLELNGRQLDLRGAAIQEDEPGRGPALGPADIRQIVGELQAVHANVTRAHYLLNPALLDALDAAGIMVWSQAPIYHRDKLLQTPAERDTALATLRDTVIAARSHPSVITHSVANELSPTPDQMPGTAAYLRAAAALVHALDPTLPVSVDLLSYPGYPAARAYEQFDLLGINSYFGWYEGKADHSTARIADLGPYLDRMRELYPTQAMVLTEFGAESTFAGPAAEKETFAFQTDYVRRVLDVVDQRPWLGGAIYWTLREFAVKPNWDGGAARKGVPRDAIHNKGLITYAGQRKPAWAVAEQDFAATSPLRTVAAADGLALPDGAGGGHGDGLLVAAVVGIGALLVVDGWALLGILRGRRRRRPELA
jgi:Glycosyl hydrolases family 2, TIM barrel domain/Glycosyl hydrolases family 2